MSKRSVYDEFALVYDRIMGALSTRRYGNFLQRSLAERFGNRKLRILDLACGSGHLAAQLSSEGHRVTGVDVSQAMLTRAREIAPAATFARYDMNAPASFSQRFDAVICLFDSVNHLLDPVALERLFARVRESLVRDGLFIFDVNSTEGFATRWKGSISFVQDDLVVTGTPTWNATTARGIFEMTWFEKAGTSVDCWMRHDIAVEEAAFSEEQIRAALQLAGFGNYYVNRAGSDPDLPDEIGREFWVGVA